MYISLYVSFCPFYFPVEISWNYSLYEEKIRPIWLLFLGQIDKFMKMKTQKLILCISTLIFFSPSTVDAEKPSKDLVRESSSEEEEEEGEIRDSSWKKWTMCGDGAAFSSLAFEDILGRYILNIFNMLYLETEVC